MSYELIYTSARAGLKPKSSGFCTVAATAGMSRQVMMKLEMLSGYAFVYNLSDPKADLNPVNFSHSRIAIGGDKFSVLSRVAFAGADHTNRSNKIAHHFLLASSEHLPIGPAAMMAEMVRTGVFREKWTEGPKELSPRCLSSMAGANGAGKPGPARHWERLTGDAGWAGVLVQAFRDKKNVPAFVVFEPGMDLLPLFVESLALLPPDERWSVLFSTYYAAAAPTVQYHWRGVLAGSKAAREILRFPNATAIDLTKSLPPLQDNDYTIAARTGTVLQPAKTRTPVAAKPVKDQEKSKPEEQPVSSETADAYDLAGEPLELEAIPSGRSGGTPTGRAPYYFTCEPKRRRSVIWPVLSICLAAALALAVFYIALLRKEVRELRAQGTQNPGAQPASPETQLASAGPQIGGPGATHSQPAEHQDGGSSGKAGNGDKTRKDNQSPASQPGEEASEGSAEKGNTTPPASSQKEIPKRSSAAEPNQPAVSQLREGFVGRDEMLEALEGKRPKAPGRLRRRAESVLFSWDVGNACAFVDPPYLGDDVIIPPPRLEKNGDTERLVMDVTINEINNIGDTCRKKYMTWSIERPKQADSHILVCKLENERAKKLAPFFAVEVVSFGKQGRITNVYRCHLERKRQTLTLNLADERPSVTYYYPWPKTLRIREKRAGNKYFSADKSITMEFELKRKGGNGNDDCFPDPQTLELECTPKTASSVEISVPERSWDQQNGELLRRGCLNKLLANVKRRKIEIIDAWEIPLATVRLDARDVQESGSGD